MSLTTDVLRLVHKATAPLRTRLNMMTARIVVNAFSEQGFQTVTATALAGEELDGIEHMQPGGMSHVALPGAEGLMVCIGGSREAPVALGIANRSGRPKDGQPGETLIYTVGPAGGTKIKCKASGEIEITPAAAVGTPLVTIIGDANVTGEVKADSGGPGVTLSQHLIPSPMGPLGPPTPGT